MPCIQSLLCLRRFPLLLTLIMWLKEKTGPNNGSRLPHSNGAAIRLCTIAFLQFSHKRYWNNFLYSFCGYITKDIIFGLLHKVCLSLSGQIVHLDQYVTVCSIKSSFFLFCLIKICTLISQIMNFKVRPLKVSCLFFVQSRCDTDLKTIHFTLGNSYLSLTTLLFDLKCAIIWLNKICILTGQSLYFDWTKFVFCLNKIWILTGQSLYFVQS